jgi:hypothetical protein
MEPKNRFQETNSARLCSQAGRYDNPIPTRFLAPVDCLKIPAQDQKRRYQFRQPMQSSELEFLNKLFGLGTEKE